MATNSYSTKCESAAAISVAIIHWITLLIIIDVVGLARNEKWNENYCFQCRYNTMSGQFIVCVCSTNVRMMNDICEGPLKMVRLFIPSNAKAKFNCKRKIIWKVEYKMKWAQFIFLHHFTWSLLLEWWWGVWKMLHISYICWRTKNKIHLNLCDVLECFWKIWFVKKVVSYRKVTEKMEMLLKKSGSYFRTEWFCLNFLSVRIWYVDLFKLNLFFVAKQSKANRRKKGQRERERVRSW